MEMTEGQRVVLRERPLSGRGELVREKDGLWLVRLENGMKVWRNPLFLLPDPD